MEKCIFCKIIDQELPSYKIYENKHVYAFLDAFPASNGHTLIIPKIHSNNFSETDSEIIAEMSKVKLIITKLLQEKLSPSGFNFLSNQEKIAGQAVFHYHEHIIPKYVDGEGFLLQANKINLKSHDEIFDLINKK